MIGYMISLNNIAKKYGIWNGRIWNIRMDVVQWGDIESYINAKNVSLYVIARRNAKRLIGRRTIIKDIAGGWKGFEKGNN